MFENFKITQIKTWFFCVDDTLLFKIDEVLQILYYPKDLNVYMLLEKFKAVSSNACEQIV